MPPKILVISGPTASGKTRLAVELALRHGGEVVSADSMQVYRDMAIGTARPTPEEMAGVPHHMMGVVDPRENYSVARYVQEATAWVEDILRRGKQPILVGGTGLYIDGLCQGRTYSDFQPASGLRQALQARVQDELRQLDFGKWKSPEYEGEKIPTIEEVLDLGKDMKMMHIELKPYLDRDADFPERVIDAVVNAHMEDKVILTSFQYGLLGRIKEIRPEIRTAALFLNTESSLCPPTALWEDLGLTNGDPLLEELSGPQGLEKAVSIVENPDSVDEENGLLVRYLNDRLTALSSNYPGKNLVEILQQYYYQTDMLKYVSQFDFPLDYVGPEYHVCFRDTTLLQRAVEMGYHVAPWPVGDESRRDLRSVLKQNPEIIVTNKPEIVMAILQGQKAQ